MERTTCIPAVPLSRQMMKLFENSIEFLRYFITCKITCEICRRLRMRKYVNRADNKKKKLYHSL